VRQVRCPACFRRLAAVAGTSCPVHPDAGPADAPARSEPPPPPTAAGYTDLVLLGLGGTARVYAARDPSGREVALKVARPYAAARLAREAAALRELGPPAVPAFYGHGTTDEGEPYLVMERLVGEPLADWQALLPGAGAAPLGDVLELAAALGDVLDRVHALGLVHRDVKPENLFLRAGTGPLRDRLALLDFGLARPAGEAGDALELTRGGQRLGTPWYMAPEQAVEPRGVDARADVYAAGIVVYELLCGAPPFRGDATTVMQAHIARRPPPPSTVAPVPAALDAPILRALAKDRTQRFASASHLAAALAEVASGGRSSVRRLVPIVVSRVRAPITQIAAAVTPHGGHVVRVQGERQVIAFPETRETEVGIAAAVRAARRLVALGGELPVVVHVAELQVRQTARGPAVAGPAVERPAQWLPSGHRAGVVVTADAAPFLGDDMGDELAVAGALAADAGHAAEPPPFVGRAALIEEILTRLAVPCVVDVVGPPGIGRSRLLRELAARLSVYPLRVPSVERAPPAPLAVGDVAVVDDADQLDELSLAALLGDCPRLVVGRRDAIAWPRGTTPIRVLVPPLTEAESLDLVRALLGPAEGAEEATRRMVAGHAGVPARLVEHARALAVAGVIRGRPPRLVLGDPLLDDGAPATVAARLLAALPRPLAELTGLCAVVGVELLADEVAAILAQPVAYPIEVEPSAALRQLVRAGILETEGAGEHAFSSATLAETLASMLPPGVRRQHHDAALRYLLASGRRDEPALRRIVRHAAANALPEEAHAAEDALAAAARATGRVRAAEEHHRAALEWLPGRR
jgi:eukaryotic-like serine/threonine-protein kinase